MADSFFGFDASIPNEDDGGGGLEDTEECYDALNSETFGSAINGDWENIHENLVRLDRRASEIKDDNGESDLVLNLSRVGMNDFDVAKEDSEGRIQLDPSVWASPFKPPDNPPKSVQKDAFFYPNPDAFLRQYFSNPFAATSSNQTHSPTSRPIGPPSLPQLPSSQTQSNNVLDNDLIQRIEHNAQMHDMMMQTAQMQQHMMSPKPGPMKILSVEDIERNIHNQQQQIKAAHPSDVPMLSRSQTPIGIGLHQNQRQPSPSAGKRPADAKITTNGVAQPNVNGIQPNKLPPRLPPGFPAMPPMVGGAGLPPMGPMPLHPGNMPMPGGMQRPPPMPPQNYPMHPNFGMRPPPNMIPPPLNHQRMPMQMMHPPPNHPNHPNFTQNMQFNQRLVQEIQQNHPMLPPFNRMNLPPNMAPPMHPNMHMHPMFQMQMQQQQQHHHHLQQQHLAMQQQQHNNHGHGYNQGGGNNKGQYPLANPKNFSGNGNLSEDYDDYANLMSKGNKQWLITIQLAQVETGTPYIDDYYFTVFKERRMNAKGGQENQAHKDNQMNHPFSQPTGHALLVQMSIHNKDNNRHYHNQRNNHNNNNNNNNSQSSNNGNNSNNNNKNRERKSSESKENNKEVRSYKPLQFENSLGQLTVSSVTAPRKLIDMDIVGDESTPSPGSLSSTLELTTQRKSRQLLIHIESMYRVVLKLEDFENPTAIATAKVIKDRKDRERAQALELQQQIQAQLNDTALADDITEKLKKLAPALEPERTDDDQAVLLAKLLVGFAPEKAAQMMTVRKGKSLLLRALMLIKDLQQRWNIWYGICSTLPIIVKKDKDDVDGKLMALFPAFKDQLTDASMGELLKLGSLMTATVDVRKINYMFMNKFCVSCIIVLLLRAEALFTAAPDTISPAAESAWASFLTIMSTTAAANVQANQMLGATLQIDVIPPLVNHFDRFSDVQSKPLLTLLTQQPD